MKSAPDAAGILSELVRGDEGAAARLMPLVVEEIRALTLDALRADSSGQPVPAFGLVEDVFRRLAASKSGDRGARAHFVALACDAVLRVLLDHARARRAARRGSEDAVRIRLHETVWDPLLGPIDVLVLERALLRLAEMNLRHRRVVDLRFLGGLGLDDVALVLGLPRQTVRDDWLVAGAWMRRTLVGPRRPPVTPEQYERMCNAFLVACERRPGEDLLDPTGARDPWLRSEVESLLAFHVPEPDPVTPEVAPGVAPAPTEPDPAAAAAEPAVAPPAPPEPPPLPARIGRYPVRRLLFEGFEEIVYLAYHERSRRAVALKLIRPGVASERALSRLELEADALVRLRHPAIARTYEAGIADAGAGPQPFFAQQLVDGPSITEFADQARLEPRDRLALFLAVCQAVLHAHRRGIVHRALSPRNIRVDSSGRPKILDFGVARVTDSDVLMRTVETEAGPLADRIRYLSPEQIVADADELDTRCDVYALGVIGYELLAGRLPYALDRETVPDCLQVICEAPAKPLGAASEALRGDLEAIFARALVKDRDRRYSSVSELASEIERYLRDEPVLSRPPAVAREVRKLARRHRVLVLAAAAAAVGIAAALVGLGLRAGRAASEAARERAASEFLKGVISKLDAGRSGGEMKVSDLLARAASDVERELRGEPEVEAAIRTTLGAAYHGLGLDAAAEPELRRALEIRERLLGEAHPATLESARCLADVLRDRGKLSEARDLFERALAACEKSLGAEHPQALLARIGLVATLDAQGRRPEAETLLARTVDVVQRSLGRKDVVAFHTAHALAALLRDLGKLDEAEALHRQALEIGRPLFGDEHPQTLATMSELGRLLTARGKVTEAEPLLRSVLHARRRTLGEEHLDTLGATDDVAELLRQQGQPSEAEALQRRTLEIRGRRLGDDHVETLRATRRLAALRRDQGALEDAEALLRRALAGARRTLAENHRDTLDTLADLATVLQAEDLTADAARVCQELLEGCRASLGDAHARTAFARVALGECLVKLERYVAAETHLLEGYAGLRTALGPAHTATVVAASHLAHLYDAWRKPEKAAQYRAIVSEAAKGRGTR